MIAREIDKESDVLDFSPDSELTDLTLGLTSEQVAKQLTRFGYNELKQTNHTNSYVIFVRQFESTVIALLLVAALASFFARETVQAIAILTAVLLNVIIGFITEVQANRSLSALEALAAPICRTVRDGVERQIPARLLVPGDVVILDSGARVPADLLLVDIAGLSLDESMLSGESVSVYKSSAQSLISANDDCTAFHGTMILSGRGRGVVLRTGGKTKLGQLGHLLQSTILTRTPLEAQLEKLGKQLTWMTVLLCILLFLIGALRKMDLWLMMKTSIALAVAAIPEGLPVVSTLALAAGARRMIKAGALIRKLSAVETLGCTTVICTDKTGTLTENQMLVTDLVLFNRKIKISGQGYEPVGAVTEDGDSVRFLEDHHLKSLLLTAVLCNDARLENHGGDEVWHVHGDPTEGAMLVAAVKAGLDYRTLQRDYPRVSEVPFDLSRKRMITVHKNESGLIACIKGSPEIMIALCKKVESVDGQLELTEAKKSWFLEQNERLADQGLRVLAVALRDGHGSKWENADTDTVEEELTLLGLIGMADQARAGVPESIKACQDAGIRIMMITGDQVKTAISVARSLHILQDKASTNNVLTGDDLQSLSPDDLMLRLKSAQVLARVDPQMKLNVVQTLQRNGEIVAMTGDGVNDAPALKQANIGVAMGLGGTALAREASNMVITDDDFGSIASAVEEGRVIYSNIRQSIAYLLTASLASVLSVFSVVLVGAGEAFTPLQLLWLNLIMHIFPAFALALQPPTQGIMSRPPRNSHDPLLTSQIQIEIFIRSFFVMLIVLSSIFLAQSWNLPHAYTISFATLSLSLLLQAVSWSGVGVASMREFARQLGSRAMIVNLVISFSLLLVALYFAPLQTLLKTSALTVADDCLVVILSLLSFIFTFRRDQSLLN
ncbi:calcium-transporting P-type ATPase, PMR1-type [soil metagenome]